MYNYELIITINKYMHVKTDYAETSHCILSNNYAEDSQHVV